MADSSPSYAFLARHRRAREMRCDEIERATLTAPVRRPRARTGRQAGRGRCTQRGSWAGARVINVGRLRGMRSSFTCMLLFAQFMNVYVRKAYSTIYVYSLDLLGGIINGDWLQATEWPAGS